MIRNIGKFDESIRPSGEVHIAPAGIGPDAPEAVTLPVFRDIPDSPPQHSRRLAGCLRHMNPAFFAQLQQDFTDRGMLLPTPEDDPLIRVRFECPGPSLLKPTMCRLAIAQFDREGNEVARGGGSYIIPNKITP